MLLKIQESCCAAIKFAVAFASLSDPRAVFSAGDGHADRAGPLPWNKHLVLPGGGARPPVVLLSLTSFSAGDLVPRPCMSSSYGCASCRLCLLRHRVSSALVPSCPPPFLSSSTGSSHSSRSFCIQGATEVQDLPGPGECACWTFLLTPTPCLTPSCDKRTRRGSCAQEEGAVVFLRGRKTSQGTPWGVCAHGGCSLVPCRG